MVESESGTLFLQLREALNVVISVMTLILCLLLSYYVGTDIRQHGYRSLSWSTKLLIGMIFIAAGEFLRSSIVWVVIHYEGTRGTYDSDILPLIGSLILIPLGSLCIIRVLSPRRCKHLPWIASLALVVSLVAINYFF